MSRWFRSYADTHRNPKIARLSDKDFRLWHQMLCIAAENDGLIPPVADLKNLLRMRLDHCSEALRRFQSGGLLDAEGDSYAPHNWNERQFKSDTSTDRVRKFRQQRNVSGNVSVTPPDTEAESETEKKKGSGGDKSPTSYAFFGQTIKLKPSDLEKWRRIYHTIADLVAELTTLDGWWETQPADRRKNWFHPTMGMLNRKHQENLAVKANRDDDDGKIRV